MIKEHDLTGFKNQSGLFPIRCFMFDWR